MRPDPPCFQLRAKMVLFARSTFSEPLSRTGEQFVVYEDLTPKKEAERLHTVLASIVNSSDDAHPCTEVSITPSLIKVNIDKISGISAIAKNIFRKPQIGRMLNLLRSATKSKRIQGTTNSVDKEIIKVVD